MRFASDGHARGRGAAGTEPEHRGGSVSAGRGSLPLGETTAMARPMAATEYDLVVRPRAALLRSTALSVLFSAVPLAVALLWVSFPERLWALVATVAVVFLALTALLFVRFRAAFVGVGPRRFVLRGVLTPNVAVDRSIVDRIVLATTYGGSSDRTTRELLGLSATGEPVFRMRSVLWDDAEISRVAAMFDVQVTDLTKPMPLREFYRRYPGSRTWYERRNAMIAVGAIAVAAVALALIAETTGLLPG
jgi:hypothetical protein